MTTLLHWARWGDPGLAQPLPESARGLVEAAFGPLVDRPTVDLAAVRLPEPALAPELVDGLRALVGAEHVHLDHETRVRHTRGKSTPDLLRMRAGDGSDAPDVVVRPAGHDEVAAVVEWCGRHQVALVPFGGGTSVVGGLAARRDGYAGVLALDLARLDRLVALDAESGTAVLEAGRARPTRPRRCSPSTASRSATSRSPSSTPPSAASRRPGPAGSRRPATAGSTRWCVGLRVATPIGTWQLGHAPASAAGPDLRQLVLGSEGAFGVITEVTLRVRPVPPVRVYEGWRFGSFAAGAAARARPRPGGRHADRAPAVGRDRDGGQPVLAVRRRWWRGRAAAAC